MKLIAICGGIGSGKSVISQILSLLGYEVYDCDSRAKLLMDNSEEIKTELFDYFGNEVLDSDRNINRRYLSKRIFGDIEALNRVNSIVHPRVVSEIVSLAKNSRNDCYFFETALPQESGLDSIADEVWLVTAPVEERIARVQRRNGMSRDQVMRRINSQDYSNIQNDNVKIIVNDGRESIINQTCNLINTINNHKPQKL